ncbi:hypothetical protein COCOR_02375 [Corallococcus coralloides DSM 2259]|uniref:Uncharacterized protein n=1 Tax=Corallococcus coralloides (strain ATCC 25202 / DSM 2259 / NBRC 100086 / M2) TaxID=1144275 RepID=H8MN76_CORCM|nr:hypothetical protein [Corallococcus coralloides]AFE04621.1 hypothetical protein COCOR_02375 [Corallococcus coralloides DSM 2259]
MASVKREVLEVAGDVCMQLDRQQRLDAVLERAWRSSTHFALIRRGRMRVDGADVVVPTPELKRLQRDFERIRGAAVESRWVSSWPGTTSGSSAALWVRCRTNGGVRLPLNEESLWNGIDRWDDFQLFEGPKLKLFVCSHEGFGTVWGNERFFRDLGIAPSRWKPETHELVGEPMAPAAWSLLMQGTPIP